MARTKQTIPPEIAILNVLSKNQEVEQYKLPKETGLSYRTILRMLTPLEESWYISLVRTEPSKKGGKEKKIFSIDLEGLIYLLSWKRSYAYLNSEYLDIVAATHPNLLPLIFGKWQFFSVKGIKEKIVENLNEYFKSYSLPTSSFQLRISARKMAQQLPKKELLVEGLSEEQALKMKKFEEFQARILKKLEKAKKQFDEAYRSKEVTDTKLTQIYIHVLLPKSQDDWGNFIKALRQEADIRTFLDKRFRYEMEFTQRELENWKNTFDYWNKLP